MSPWTKECTCCGATYDSTTWPLLAFVGHMEGGDGWAISLRNCTCGTTLSVDAADDPRSLEIAA